MSPDAPVGAQPGGAPGRDWIYLHGMRAEAVIGIFAWERRVKQTVILDIDLNVDVGAGAQNDDIRDTLDYKAVAKRVLSFVTESQFRLVETLAEGVAELILNEFDVPRLRLRVNKRWALRGVKDVGVAIERCREQRAP